MGYSIRTLDTNFTIPSNNMEEAHKALCQLNSKDAPNNEGSFQGQASTSALHSVEDIMQELGFLTDILPSGDLTVLSYNGKSADEEDFLEALAPFVEDGSYIEWIGEDNSLWRDYFVDGDMFIESGSIMWY